MLTVQSSRSAYSVKIDDTNLIKFKKQLARLNKMRVRLGAVGMHEGGISNSDLFIIQEYGAPLKNGGRIPARAYLRRTFQNQTVLKGIQDRVQKLIANNYSNGEFNFDAILTGLGEDMVGSLRETITRGDTVPLADSTIKARRKKGIASTIPGIATAQMINSLQYEVVK